MDFNFSLYHELSHESNIPMNDMKAMNDSPSTYCRE